MNKKIKKFDNEFDDEMNKNEKTLTAEEIEKLNLIKEHLKNDKELQSFISVFGCSENYFDNILMDKNSDGEYRLTFLLEEMEEVEEMEETQVITDNILAELQNSLDKIPSSVIKIAADIWFISETRRLTDTDEIEKYIEEHLKNDKKLQKFLRRNGYSNGLFKEIHVQKRWEDSERDGICDVYEITFIFKKNEKRKSMKNKIYEEVGDSIWKIPDAIVKIHEDIAFLPPDAESFKT